MSQSKRIILQLLIILFSIGVLVIISIYFIQLINSVNYRAYLSDSGLTTHRVSSRKFTYSEWGVSFYLSEIKPTTYEVLREYLKIELTSVNFPLASYQEDTLDSSICVNKVNFQSVNVYSDNSILMNNVGRTWHFSNACPFLVIWDDYYGPGDKIYLEEGMDRPQPFSTEVSSDIIRGSDLYPFDEIDVNFLVSINVNERLSDNELHKKDIAAPVKLELNAPTWQPEVEFSEVNEYGKNHTLVQIRLLRPLAYRVITIVVFSIIFFMIGVMFFLNDSGNVLEVSVGVLFSLWGIKSSLLPDYLSGTFTLIDGLVWASYIFLAYILMNRFFLKPIFISIGRHTVSIEYPQNMSIKKLSAYLENVDNIKILEDWISKEIRSKNRKGAIILIGNRIEQINKTKDKSA